MAGFVVACAALLLLACGSEQPAAPTPTPAPTLTPAPPSHVATDYFPVTVVVETDKGWLTVGSVTKADVPESETQVRLDIEGSIKVLSPGRFDYRLSVTDSEGIVYVDSGGIRLGERQEGEDPSYRTSITVPANATFVRVGFWLDGEGEPELSYLVDLPVAGISAGPP